MRTCTTCEQTKPESAFYIRKDRQRPYLRRDCKECVKARSARRYRERCEIDRESVRQEGRDWRDRNRDKLAAQGRRQRLRKYGMTEDDFAAMVDTQDGRCAICGTSFSEAKVNVDHCHETGVVRGLLCCRATRRLGSSETTRTCSALPPTTSTGRATASSTLNTGRG